MHIPCSEAGRLAALDRCRILDTAPEPCFDRISRLAAQFFNTPSAVVSFVTQDRSWFKSRYRFETAEFTRQASFCAYTVLGHSPLVIPDARADERFADLPIVVDRQGIRFYAGVPLTTRDGFAVGTLAVMDTHPRGSCSDAQLSALLDLGAILEEELNRRSVVSAPEPSDGTVQRILNAVPALLWACDAEGQATLLTNFWHEFSGRPLSDGRGHGWLDLVHPQDRPSVRVQIQTAIETGVETSLEFRLRRADGEYRWVLDQARPQFRADGRFDGYAGICFDITERKRTEHDLRASEERLRILAAEREHANEALSRLSAVVQSSNDAIISVDLDGHMLTWNPAAERLYGYSADEVQGRSLNRLIVPPDRTEEVAHAIARIKLGDSIPRFETVRVRKDGARVSVSLCLSAIKNDHGDLIAISSIASDITQVKQAEAALRESEERLRLAQDAAGIGIWDWHVPEAAIVCSDQFFRLHGLPPRDSPLPDAEWLSLVHPDDRERMRAYSNGLLREKTHGAEEFRVVWPDGSVHWIVGKAEVHRSAAGEAVRVTGIGLDVTDLKLAEQARRESEEQYANLFRTMNPGVLYLDGGGVVLSANPAAERILGLAADQMCGRPRSDLHWQATKEDGSALPLDETPSSISLRTGRELHGVVARIRNSRSQEHRWLSIDTIPQFKPGEEKPYQLYAIFQDITVRVKAEEQRRASEERFRLLLEHGLEVIAILDAAATIRYMSASVARVFGYQADFLLGTNALDYMHPDDRPAVRQAFEKMVLSPNSTTSVQFRIQHHDGTWRHAEGAATNCLHIEGLRGMVTNLRDITEQKTFEQQLQASRHQLRQLAAHIESAREEERIRIAREVHDELGQILSVLKLDLDGLALKHRDRSPAMRKDFTERITRIVRTVDLTINTVRKISAGLRPSILSDLGLSAALKWQIQEFESRTGIRCRCRGLRKDAPLGTEPSIAAFRIFQAILTNVVWHAKAKAVSVELRTSGGWLILRVADDGQGLDPKRLSDPLSLGLLGMRERALLLGGRVDFAARRGGGTVVTVRIPTGEPAATPPGVPSSDKPHSACPAPLRILLVGDPDVFRSGMKSVLLQAYPDAVLGESRDGDQLLDGLRASEWDLVVIELSSSSSSGLDALDTVRKLPSSPPVLAVTAHAEPAYARWVVQAGASRSIDESCSATQIRIAVEAIFTGRRFPPAHD